ncbi:MAG: hypothetical protein Q9186_003308 [Xanthomendoza sp. 1 TL-2023]
MVLGLLAIAAIPTTIGVAESISASKKKNSDDDEEQDPFVTATTEPQRMRKFHLRCYCDGKSSKAKEIDGGMVGLRDQRVGFYVPYPDPTRHPPPLGLVSFTPDTPPMLNWIFIHTSTREVRYGNRTTSIDHVVGPWAWDLGDDEEEGNGGGLTLRGEEAGWAVEGEGGWGFFWEDEKGEVGEGGKGGGRRLRVSVERVFVEEEGDGGGVGGGVKEKGGGKDGVKEKVEVRDQRGEKKGESRTETVLEVRTKKVVAEDEGKGKGKGKEKGKKKEEKTRYEYRA